MLWFRSFLAHSRSLRFVFDFQWIYFSFTADYNQKSVFIDRACMTSTCTGLLIDGSLTFRCLWFNLFPLCNKLDFPVTFDFFNDLDTIEIIKDHITVTLSPENVNFIVNLRTWVTISTLRDYTLLDTSIPTEFAWCMGFHYWSIGHGWVGVIGTYLDLGFKELSGEGSWGFQFWWLQDRSLLCTIHELRNAC